MPFLTITTTTSTTTNTTKISSQTIRSHIFATVYRILGVVFLPIFLQFIHFILLPLFFLENILYAMAESDAIPRKNPVSFSYLKAMTSHDYPSPSSSRSPTPAPEESLELPPLNDIHALDADRILGLESIPEDTE